MIHGFRHWRRSVKAKMPYVRRREYRKVMQRFEALAETICVGVPRADRARIVELKAPSSQSVDELCLFLSYQPGTTLKRSVQTHISALLERGIRVVLILNTATPVEQIRIDPALADRLEAIYVRENLGYDFAGWAHVHTLLAPRVHARRLYLVNDSITGPFDDAAFDRMIGRIRASKADMIGLTEAMSPRPHLQSFFLVFNERAVTEIVGPFLRDVLCFPTKGTVIDLYETRLTQHLRRAGFVCEPVFPPLTKNKLNANDTYYMWQELLEAGFPFVKVSIANENPDHPTIRRLMAPERFSPK